MGVKPSKISVGIFLQVLVIIVILLSSSCKDGKETNGMVTIQFDHFVANEALQFKSALKYTNQSGNIYNIGVCRYIVGKFKLTHSDGTIEEVGTYQVVDADDPATQKISFSNIKPGDYTGISFVIGVDSVSNNNYLLNGIKPSGLESDVSMNWSGMGFRFFVIEGEYKNDTAASSVKSSYGYHIGLNENLNTYTFPASSFHINGNEKTAHVKVDFAKFFDGKNKWDISKQETNHSENSRRADTRKLGENIGQMYSLTAIN